MSKDTRSALTRKLIKQLNYNKKRILVDGALVEHELGRVLMLWSPKLIATVDAANIDLPCTRVDVTELYKALEITDSFEEAIKLSVNTDDDGDPPEIPMTPVMDAWTPELSAICRLASSHKIHMLEDKRPNLACIERVPGGSLCITNGYVLYEVDAGDIPDGFSLPAYLAQSVHGLQTYINPQFVSFGRHDGGDFISVASITACGRLCTMSMLYYKRRQGDYPSVEQLYKNYVTKDKRLHTYTLTRHQIEHLNKTLKVRADVTSKNPKEDMIVDFDFRTPGYVTLHNSKDKQSTEYTIKELADPSVQQGSDDLADVEPAMSAEKTSNILISPKFLYTALCGAQSAEINVAFYSRHPVSLYLDIDDVSVRGMFMPLTR